MIEVSIRVCKKAGQWRLQALEISDEEGHSYNFYGEADLYASPEEVVVLAKVNAQERIADVWGSVPGEKIRWHVWTIPDQQTL
jgi:hypothetical protein